MTSRRAYLGLRSGEWVEVSSKEEILATLDADGQLDGLPFMPEMLQFCGKRFQVSKRAEKACDTIHKTGARRMLDAVHLADLRCDGSVHGGCQADCLLFWKEAWVRRVSESRTSMPESYQPGVSSSCTEDGLRQSTRVRPHAVTPDDEVYRCQATQMFAATRPMHWWDLRQYWRDWRCGNVTATQVLRAAIIANVNMILRRLGRTYPRHWGNRTSRTPAGTLDLAPGELVQIKTQKEILATLNEHGRNRGLSFDPEMVRYCGRRFRVRRRVERIISERTGRMLRLPNDCIVLEGVTCLGDLSPRRLFCQRAILPFWRELWLRRLDPGGKGSEVRS